MLRTGAALTGTAALGSVAGCLGGPGRSKQVAYPLDRDDPTVRAARVAEKRAYEHYGLDFSEHLVGVPELDLEIRVVEVGAGPPVVVIPGGIGEGMKWLPLLPELEGYTAYVMDRPGGGLSDGIDHRTRPLREIAASSTKALFDNFDLDEAPIVGSSMGGLWTLRFALAHPERVGPIALLGTPATFPGENVDVPQRIASLPMISGVMFENVVQPDNTADVREGWERNGHPEETATGLPEAYAEATYRMDNLPYFTLSWTSLIQSVMGFWGNRPGPSLQPKDLREIRSPVLLLWGGNDPFGSIETGRAGAEHFRDAEFHEAGVGHLPWLDAPEACGELVRGFLGENA
ncbi:alpha/beta fold hydrolase [Salinigranum rubrum]|uniref:alpha/beta fold hydrolase n=1 Tax=Salinigranum rubrum TaxID=755307 RepID=UPI0013A5B4C6|nr:alpha/beta hydrolase [Salinigranum rubrum]